MGLEMAGYETIMAVESDVDAWESFRLNHPRAHAILARCQDVPRYPKADLYWLSPPCVNYSPARASKKLRTADANLKWSLDFVKALPPEATYVIENVDIYDLPEAKGMRRFLLDAADYGVPQHRVRTFLTNAELPFRTWPHVSAGDALSKAELPPPGIYPHIGFDWDIARYRDWGPARATLDATRPSPTIVDQRHGGVIVHRTFTNRAGRLEVPLTEASPAITTGHDHLGMKVDPEECRQMTLAEAMVLQTIPLDYRLAGSLSSQFKQVGNAVPPLWVKRLLGHE